MWERRTLKEKAKKSFKANYWLVVLVALILGAISGGSYSGGNSFNDNESAQKIESKIEKTMDGENVSDLDDMAEALSILGIKEDEVSKFEEKFDEMSDAEKNEIGAAIGVAGVVIGMVILVVSVLALVFNFLIVNPLVIGCRRFFTRNLSEKAQAKEIVFAFDNHYKNGVKIMFQKDLYTVLWTLLFIIPGIVKTYEYRMVSYLVAMNPDISSEEAFARSKEMMNGNKWRAFVLDLSFIGWDILNVFTLGILGVFYVNPYRYQTQAALFEALYVPQN